VTHNAGLAALFSVYLEPPEPGRRSGRLLGRYAREVVGPALGLFCKCGDRLSAAADLDLIHDFRVMARRLSEHLEVLAYAVPEPLAVSGKDFLDTVVRELSPVRNADESLVIVRRALARDLSALEQEALLRVERRLRRRREKRLDEALRFWRRDDVQDRLAELMHLKAAAFQAPSAARRRFAHALAQHVRQRARLALGHLDHLPPDADDRRLHAMRLDARRLRYMGEATRPLLRWPAARVSDRLVRVARVLGQHHDLAVALRRVAREKEGLDREDPADAALLKGLERVEARLRRLQASRTRAFQRLRVSSGGG
jgi:CHAD domain-containing protein